MNVNEMATAVKGMDRQELDVIRNIVEERSVVIRSRRSKT
jgi:hypothetical protein